MRMEGESTAVADHDPSCNLLTLSEVQSFRLANPPTAAKINELLKRHKVRSLDMWPQNQSKPTLIPLDGHLAGGRDRDRLVVDGAVLRVPTSRPRRPA
jgi:hypothetical protein